MADEADDTRTEDEKIKDLFFGKDDPVVEEETAPEVAPEAAPEAAPEDDPYAEFKNEAGEVDLDKVRELKEAVVQYRDGFETINTWAKEDKDFGKAWLKMNNPEMYEKIMTEEKPAPAPDPKAEKTPKELNEEIVALFKSGDVVGGIAKAQEHAKHEMENKIHAQEKKILEIEAEKARHAATQEVQQELNDFQEKYADYGLYERTQTGYIPKDTQMIAAIQRVLNEGDRPFEEALAVAQHRLGRLLSKGETSAADIEDRPAKDAKKRSAMVGTKSSGGATKVATSNVDVAQPFGIFDPEHFKAVFGERAMTDWKDRAKKK